MSGRLSKLRKLMESQAPGFDALLIESPENRYYMSGFSGSAGFLVIGQDHAYLITDFRYTEQATAQAPEFKVVQHGTPFVTTLIDVLTKAKVKRLGFEKEHLTYGRFEDFRAKLDPVEMVPTENLVEDLRAVKDAGEVNLIKEASAIADKAFQALLGRLKTRMTETDVVAELEYQMRKLGAAGASFDIIAASGQRSSLPHAEPTDRPIDVGDFLTIDFGAEYKGYRSDCTRTVVFGRVNKKQREVYDIVLRAQEAAIAAAKPGMLGKELDAVARKVIADAGYGANFGHGLGHGVGLAIHEAPGVGLAGEKVLKPGHVITIEPGIYLAGWGGVRIEDMGVLTAKGFDDFTTAPKQLITLD
ncbi:MAG: M24 family metallopeptidase [Bacillota bacterium]